MYGIIGQKFIFAVAQRPFETANENGIVNHFCSLLPLCDVNGVPASPNDFPDNGDVWWMLRPSTRGLAQPGRLVTAVVEESVKSGHSGFAQFQANTETVTALSGRDYVEVITIPSNVIKDPRDLIAEGFYHVLDHPPLDVVCLRWKEFFLGRFRTTCSESNQRAGYWDIRFSPEMTDHTVFKAPRNVPDQDSASKKLNLHAHVSIEDRPINESSSLHPAHYLLIDNESLMANIPSDCERISIKSDKEVVLQLAKSLLTRRQRQHLSHMLKDLEASAAQSNQSLDETDLRVLDSVQRTLESDLNVSKELTKAIIAGDFLAEQIQQEIASIEEKHISENAARLQSDINKRISEIREEYEELKREKKTIQTELEHLRSRKMKELEKELKAKQDDLERELRKKEDEASKRLDSIQKQEKVLTDNLAKVSQNLVENQNEIVNHLLTIVPVLNESGLLRGGSATAGASASVSENAEMSNTVNVKPFEKETADTTFDIPEFVVPGELQPVDEVEFFSRFKNYTLACGYRYRDIDLLAYHVSVKCGDLTILGGQPGTGKSSLPRLYSEALCGSQANKDCERYLQVAVSPSWLDSRDLMGHFNALSNTFQPADQYLFETLVYAQEEYQELAEESGLYFVCLDEMNLSHVEHYFGGFLQVLEKPSANRRLRVFSKDAVASTCRFKHWPSLMIPRSVRFIGTVNFDETTKQLSQRLLDRANLIRLPADHLPLELEDATEAVATGVEVRMHQYQEWIRDSVNYNEELGKLIDDLRDDLRVLNCSMNPRRFSAIRKFLASWPEDISSIEHAIDLQFAQRILPQVRGLFQPGATEAIKSIRKKIEHHSFAFEESLRILDEIYRSESPEFMYNTEEMI